MHGLSDSLCVYGWSMFSNSLCIYGATYKKTLASLLVVYLFLYNCNECMGVEPVQSDNHNNIQDNEKSRQLTPNDTNIDDLQLYRSLLKHKRAAHIAAVQSILSLEKYEKQYSMVKLIMDKMMKVMVDSRVRLMEKGYTPGDPFPSEEESREDLSHIAENTAFLGDILLRLPDITHDILKRNYEWDLTVKWSVGFCNETEIFDAKDQTLLKLMAQELGIVDEDPDYTNPYKAETRTKQIIEEEVNKVVEEAVAKARKNKPVKPKKKKKGPRLSSRHTEF